MLIQMRQLSAMSIGKMLIGCRDSEYAFHHFTLSGLSAHYIYDNGGENAIPEPFFALFAPFLFPPSINAPLVCCWFIGDESVV